MWIYVWCWELGSRAFAQIKKPYSQMGKWAPCSNGKRWKSARKELKFSLVCTADGARGSAVHIKQNKSAVREKSLFQKRIYSYTLFRMRVTQNFINYYQNAMTNFFGLIFVFCSRGATGAARASKPGKPPIMAARRRCRRRLLFFKIEVRPWPCRPYRVRRRWLGAKWGNPIYSIGYPDG